MNVKYDLYRWKWKLAPYIHWKYPVHIDIELSSLCNMRCVFCPHSSETQDFDKKFMDMKLFTKIIDEIAGKVPSIKFNLRGESTIHPYFEDMLNYAHAAGFIDLRLNTNGQYRDAHLNEVIAQCCTEVCFSVDAYYPATYEAIHGLPYEYVENNIMHLIQLNSKHCKLKVSFVESDKNAAEKEQFVNYWRYMGVNVFARREWDRINGTGKGYERKNCNMLDRRLVIASNGDIYPCCVQWHKPFMIIGNTNTDSIIEHWNSPAVETLRKNLRNITTTTDSLPSCCKTCDSRESYKLRRKK